MISSILNGDFTYVFGFVKMASDILLLLLLIYNERDKVRKMVVLSYSYIYGAVLGGLLGLIDFLITGRGINVYGVARMDGIFGDGNYYSVAMAFAIALVLVLILHKNKISFIDVTALAILALLGFETISRGFLITFAVIGLIFIVYFVFSRQMKLIYKFSSIFSIALFAAIAISKTDILDRYVIRMTSKDIVSGNGRFDLWSYYLNSLFSSREGPFIGLGSSIKAIALHPTLQMEHNTYVQFLYSIGIVGSVLFLLVAVAFYKDVKMVCASGKKSPLTFLPIVSTLCSVFFISAMTWENFIYPLFIGILVLLNLRKNDGGKNKYVLA
jgi:O-antigen ligase